MKGGRRWIVAILAILVVISIFFRRTLQYPRAHPKPAAAAAPAPTPVKASLGEVGAHLPDLRLTDISGHAVLPDVLRGKVLLIDYWAPWCMPCEREMPGYQRLQDKYRSRGLVVLGVVFDPGMSMGDETAEHFAKRLHIRYSLIQDSLELQKQFGGIQGVPTTYLFDRNGILRYKVVGFEHTEVVEKALQPFL